MKIGIVSLWCNRGQATVSRHIRSIFEDAGHETFILARPLNPILPMNVSIDRRGHWDVPRITDGSRWDLPGKEYIDWVRATGIDTMFCDMNFQFDEVEAVRRLGVRTIGRFVWERFEEKHVAAALRAYDVIYSLTRSEQARYASLGVNSPYLNWGLPPELLSIRGSRRGDGTDFFFHGGMLGPRKPIESTVAAFKGVSAQDSRLILKSQCNFKKRTRAAFSDDSRIEAVATDLPTDEYLKLFASSHVCLAPARWEGLGVHLYEALALGMPVVANDIAPINEVVKNGVSGLLCRSEQTGCLPSGIPIYEPNKDHLRECMEALCDFSRLAEMTAATLDHRKQFAWNRTREDFCSLATLSLAV